MISIQNEQLSWLINNLSVEISEYCFSNFYCFQDSHNFEYKITETLPYVVGQNPGLNYLTPLFVPSIENLGLIKMAMTAGGYSLYPIDETWKELFQNDKNFIVSADEKDFDYIYLRDKLALLSGRKLSKKRNLVSQFVKSYPEASTQNFSSKNANDAISVLEEWTKESSDSYENTDYAASLLGIQNIGSLNLTGIIVYNQTKPIAFSLGEQIRDSYILHFAKANIHYKGAYQFLFQETAKHIQNATWINFEQDLGKPQLKKMKDSYYPDKIIKKYTISLASNL